MIVDSSALIAIVREEDGSEVLRQRLVDADELKISAGTMLEVKIVATRRSFEGQLSRLIREFGFKIVPVDEAQVEIALRGFEKFGKGRHPANLNFGDCFTYSLAKMLDEPLLYKGNDFSQTDVTSAV